MFIGLSLLLCDFAFEESLVTSQQFGFASVGRQLKRCQPIEGGNFPTHLSRHRLGTEIPLDLTDNAIEPVDFAPMLFRNWRPGAPTPNCLARYTHQLC